MIIIGGASWTIVGGGRRRIGVQTPVEPCTQRVPTDGAYRVQVMHQQSKCWFEIEHLHVKQILKEQVMQSESYIQIWKRTYYGPKDQISDTGGTAHLNAYQENDKDKM